MDSKRLLAHLFAAVVGASLLVAAGAGTAAAAGPEWSGAKLSGLAGELFLLNVSCPSSSLCVATGTQNVIASSTDPTGGAGAWRVVYAGEGFYTSPSGPVISSRQIQGVSCPTAQLCIAVTTLGQIYSTTNPTGPASAWKVAEVPSERGNTHLYGVSCPTPSLCVTVSGRRANRGKIFTSTDPTGGSATWQVADLGESFDFRAVSCSSASLCVAAGANGELVASTDPTGGPSAWSSLGAPGGPGSLQTVACIPGLCLSGNVGGNLLTSTNPLQASSWREASGGGSVLITGTSCATVSACVAVDANGHVLASTDPTGAADAWSSTTLAPYTPEAEQFDPEHPNGLFGASCPSTSLCAVVGSGGQIFTSTNPFASPSPASSGPGGSSKTKARGPKRPRVMFARFKPPTPKDVKDGRSRIFVRFHANGRVRRFECRVDRHRYRRCHSPMRFTVPDGRHALRVRAIGSTGLRGRAAVLRFWTGHLCVRHGKGTSCQTGGGELPPRFAH